MKNILYFFVAALTLSSCSHFTKGDVAKLSASSSYQKGKAMRVLVLPLIAEGNPDMQTNGGYSDALATTLLDLGMKPIDQAAAQSEAHHLGFALDSTIVTDHIHSLALALHADALLLGTVRYNYIPPSSGSSAPSFSKTKNPKTGKEDISIDGGSSYATGGYYSESALSIRIVDANSAETLIAGYVEQKDLEGYMNSDYRYRTIDEMITAMKNHLKM